MLEDLRDDADFVEEDDPGYEYQNPTTNSQTQFMGMSPEQRFVIAVMILLSVCILGLFFLLITGSLTLPV